MFYRQNHTVLVEYDIEYSLEEWQQMMQDDLAAAVDGSGRSKRKAVSDRDKRWTNKIVPWKYGDTSFSSSDKKLIQNAIADYHRYRFHQF